MAFVIFKEEPDGEGIEFFTFCSKRKMLGSKMCPPSPPPILSCNAK